MRKDIPAWGAYIFAILAGWLPYLYLFPQLANVYFGHNKTDMKLTYRHWIRFTMRSVHEGELPLWNPYIFCGQPYMPSTHGTLFYPPNWLWLFGFDQPLSINLCILTQIAILAAGTVWFAKTRGSSNTGALLAGIVASMGSLMTCRVFVGHFTIMCTAPWIPVLFGIQERLFRSGRAWALPLAIAGAVMFMGGHLQYAYYYGLIMGTSLLLYGWVSVSRSERASWYLWQILLHAGAAGLAFLIVAIEALPALDIARNSLRSGSRNAEWLRHFSMPPENLLTLLAPRFFGKGIDYWGRWEWWEACFYFSIPALVLALTALTLQFLRKKPSHIGLLFLVCVGLAVAGFVPLLPHLLGFMPGWIMFRGHNRLLSFALVFGAVLAAEGLDMLTRRERRSRQVSLIWLGACSAILLVMLSMANADFWRRFIAYAVRSKEFFNANPVLDSTLFAKVLDTSHNSLLVGLALCLATALLLLISPKFMPHRWNLLLPILATADLMFFAAGPAFFREEGVDVVPRQTAAYFASMRDQWRSGVPRMINEGTSHRIPSIEGDDIVVTRYNNTLLCAYLGAPRVVPNFTFFLQGESPILDAANFAYVAMPPDAPAARSSIYERIGMYDDLLVVRRKTALPRAYLVGRSRWVTNDEQAILRELKKTDFQREVLLVGQPQQEDEKDFAAIPLEAQYIGLHKVKIDVPLGKSGWLVLADGYYPWWKVNVTSHDEANRYGRGVYRANSSFRAVRVSEGEKVVFKYSNPFFQVGAILSLMALALTAGMGIYTFRKRAK